MSILRATGVPFQRGMSLADKFASEWRPILGEIHIINPLAHLEVRFDHFVHIPTACRVSANEQIMRSI